MGMRWFGGGGRKAKGGTKGEQFLPGSFISQLISHMYFGSGNGQLIQSRDGFRMQAIGSGRFK